MRIIIASSLLMPGDKNQILRSYQIKQDKKLPIPRHPTSGCLFEGDILVRIAYPFSLKPPSFESPNPDSQLESHLKSPSSDFVCCAILSQETDRFCSCHGEF